MNLREKLKILESHNKYFDEKWISSAFEFLRYLGGKEALDDSFRTCLRNWEEKKDTSSKMGVNILLHFMAIANTHEYRQRRDGLEMLAAEVDLDYTPNYFEGLLSSDDFIPKDIRNQLGSARIKTKIRKGKLEAGHYFLRTKDEKYAMIEDLFEKAFILTKQ